MEAVASQNNVTDDNKINDTQSVGHMEDDAFVPEMCALLPDTTRSNLAEEESLRLELIRQLDCGAVSPFDTDDEFLANGNEDLNQHLTEDIGLTSVQSALEMQRQMVDLQVKQNATIVRVLEQQKETNKYLNEMAKDKSENNNVLGRHFEEQKIINNRLEELLTLFKTQVEIKVK